MQTGTTTRTRATCSHSQPRAARQPPCPALPGIPPALRCIQVMRFTSGRSTRSLTRQAPNSRGTSRWSGSAAQHRAPPPASRGGSPKTEQRLRSQAAGVFLWEILQARFRTASLERETARSVTPSAAAPRRLSGWEQTTRVGSALRISSRRWSWARPSRPRAGASPSVARLRRQ